MKIKIDKVYDNFLKQKLRLERVSHNAIEITGTGTERGGVSILLPESFDLESKAVEQLMDLANFTSPLNGRGMKCACATPDFHPGSSVPVGCVVVSPHDMVIPSAIGTDINCGMRLHSLGVDLAQYLGKKTEFLNLLKTDLLGGTRDLPTTGKSMQALFDSGLGDFFAEMKKSPKGIFNRVDWAQLDTELSRLHKSAFLKGNAHYAPESLMNRAWLRDPSLGTLGGGNHFCEIQVVKQLVDRKKCYELGIKVGDVMAMIHTGSRDVGFYVGQQWMDKAKNAYPKDMKYPEHKIFGLEGDMASEYLGAMTSAAHYAQANRALIAEVVRQRAIEVFKNTSAPLITDVPHNIVIQEDISYTDQTGQIIKSRGNVHRKGATPAHEGDLLLIPGSMGHDSYLLSGLGSDKWLHSASHGAGRSVARGEMSYRARKNKNLLGLDGVDCITLKEERKIEEAPGAYKEIGPVIESQVSEGTVSTVCIFSPLTTFKA